MRRLTKRQGNDRQLASNLVTGAGTTIEKQKVRRERASKGALEAGWKWTGSVLSHPCHSRRAARHCARDGSTFSEVCGGSKLVCGRFTEPAECQPIGDIDRLAKGWNGGAKRRGASRAQPRRHSTTQACLIPPRSICGCSTMSSRSRQQSTFVRPRRRWSKMEYLHQYTTMVLIFKLVR